MPELLKIKTCEMHTSGGAVRIIESIEPAIEYPPNSTILEKKKYLSENYDFIRKMTIFEPRGHREMFAAILTEPNPNGDADFGMIFLGPYGFFSMCGHITISVGRYLIEKGLVKPTIPETEIKFDCPCGLIKASVEWNGERVGNTKFVNIPIFIKCPDFEIFVPEFQRFVVCDIVYSGNFFALISSEQLGIDFSRDSQSKILDTAATLKSVLDKNTSDINVETITGVYVYDFKPPNNVINIINVLSRNSFDHSPCGSGTSALTALQYLKGNIKKGDKIYTQTPYVSTESRLQGKPVGEICSNMDGDDKTRVLVEVSGRGYFTGENILTYEEDDCLRFGFLV